MAGENTLSGPMAYGTLEFDALAVKGIPVIGLTGPFALTIKTYFSGVKLSRGKEVCCPETSSFGENEAE